MNTGFGHVLPGLLPAVLSRLSVHQGPSWWRCSVGGGRPAPDRPRRLLRRLRHALLILPERRLMLTAEDIMGVLERPPGSRILDVRDVDEWVADSSSPYGKDFCPRKGRIPGARLDRMVPDDEAHSQKAR